MKYQTILNVYPTCQKFKLTNKTNKPKQTKWPPLSSAWRLPRLPASLVRSSNTRSLSLASLPTSMISILTKRPSSQTLPTSLSLSMPKTMLLLLLPRKKDLPSQRLRRLSLLLYFLSLGAES